MERLIEAASVSPDEKFDIFLSHCSRDAQLIDGVYLLLKDKGFRVYADWVVDPHLDPSSVTADTADILRARMRQCETLVYVHTPNSGTSKWMPWELGFFDGHSGGRVSILPVVEDDQADFDGQEYLGMYPVVDFANQDNGREMAWVHRGEQCKRFDEWAADPVL